MELLRMELLQMDDIAILDSITKLRANRNALDRLRESRSTRKSAKGSSTKPKSIDLVGLMSGIPSPTKATNLNEKGGE